MKKKTALAAVVVAAGLLLYAATTGREKESNTVNVDVHGVNYSGNEFFYSIMDPQKQKHSGVGEHLAPYAGGGTMCCFALPKQWQPGIKVQLWTRHWLPRGPDGKLPEVDGITTVAVPAYVDGKPGDLWVVRSEDGAVSVVSSIYEPGHAKWPGKVKGWPQPSIEYQRERWELYRKHEEDAVKLYQSLLKRLEEQPQQEAQEAWEYEMERDSTSLKKFQGPSDPRYLAALREEYKTGLTRSKRALEQVMARRP